MQEVKQKTNQIRRANIPDTLTLKEFLETYYAALNGIEGDRCDSRYDYNSLVSENDMNRILRYEERMHRQIDWAVQRLPEAQERRKTVDSSPDAAEARTK
jgi:hypothetical protein